MMGTLRNIISDLPPTSECIKYNDSRIYEAGILNKARTTVQAVSNQEFLFVIDEFIKPKRMEIQTDFLILLDGLNNQAFEFVREENDLE